MRKKNGRRCITARVHKDLWGGKSGQSNLLGFHFSLGKNEKIYDVFWVVKVLNT